MLVGLDILNEKQYHKYRDEISPILPKYGGGFDYNFIVSKILKPENSCSINRVFTICFPDAKKMEAFFSNTKYLLIKQQYFNNCVKSTTIIASYEK